MVSEKYAHFRAKSAVPTHSFPFSNMNKLIWVCVGGEEIVFLYTMGQTVETSLRSYVEQILKKLPEELYKINGSLKTGS